MAGSILVAGRHRAQEGEQDKADKLGSLGQRGCVGVGFIYQSRSTAGTIKGKMTPTHDIITAIDLLEFYTLCLHLGDLSLARPLF